MKKTAFIAAAAAALVLAAGCATTSVKGSGVHGKGATVKNIKREIIDYQTAGFDDDIPEWVRYVARGEYSRTTLSKVMPELEGKKIFVVTARGDNREFVRKWSDEVSVVQQVASSMETVAARAMQTVESGHSEQEGAQDARSEIEQAFQTVTNSLTNVRLTGLEKKTEYWIQYAENDGERTYFDYYTVWTMDEDVYNAQVDEAVKQIDLTTPVGQELADMLTQSLRNIIGISNDDALAESSAKQANGESDFTVYDE